MKEGVAHMRYMTNACVGSNIWYNTSLHSVKLAMSPCCYTHNHNSATHIDKHSENAVHLTVKSRAVWLIFCDIGTVTDACPAAAVSKDRGRLHLIPCVSSSENSSISIPYPDCSWYCPSCCLKAASSWSLLVQLS